MLSQVLRRGALLSFALLPGVIADPPTGVLPIFRRDLSEQLTVQDPEHDVQVDPGDN